MGTDINPTVVEFAAQHLSSDRVHFQQADAQNLPFEDASFDLVLCLFGVMFSPIKFERTLKLAACFAPEASTSRADDAGGR